MLGVEAEATPEEIKAAAQALARKFHPAKYPGNNQVAARFKKIKLIYNTLANPQKRAAYDAALAKKQAEMETTALEPSISSQKTPKPASTKDWMMKIAYHAKIHWLVYLGFFVIILGITAYL